LEDACPAVSPFEEDLERFLTAWYGPPDRPLHGLPFWHPDPCVPEALAAWHRQAARWRLPVAGVNRMLRADERWSDGDVQVIYCEPGGAWLWGIPRGRDVRAGLAADPDPPVLERDASTKDGTWTATGERLGDFLLHVALVEAILGAPARLGLDDADPHQLRELTADMACVRVPAWRWPGPRHTLWQRGPVLALTCVNRLPDSVVEPDCTWWVVIGARDPADLDFARGLGIRFDIDTHPA
jgi:hypothetical protein